MIEEKKLTRGLYMRTLFGYTIKLEGYTNQVRMYRSYTTVSRKVI
jgi:hypothetical protein